MFEIPNQQRSSTRCTRKPLAIWCLSLQSLLHCWILWCWPSCCSRYIQGKFSKRHFCEKIERFRKIGFKNIFQDNICNYPPDFDTHIADQTDDPSGNHELIPRFDMAWAALNEYAHMDVARPNNLFIHGGYTDKCGPGKGRGCTANTCVQQILPGATCQSYPEHINGPYTAPGK